MPASSRLGRIAIASAVAILLASCSAMETIDYYWSSAAGEMDLLTRAQPIPQVIEQTQDEALAARLKRVREIRSFASHDLGLPDNGSYTRYTELGRPYVLWNVFAAPELSLTPRQWCFPVAGCVNYRGYFNEAQARTEADKLAAAGDDAYIGGVPAYSTLGWFDDPVLSTFVRWPETELARLIFHELAHQLLYVKDDSVFNESFAVTVEEAGVKRWLAAQNNPDLDRQFARNERLRTAFRDVVAKTRATLLDIYASPASDEMKRKLKAEAFVAMRTAYEQAKAGEPGLANYDRWFAQSPNNASLAAFAVYTERVPAFQALLAQEGGDLPRFYARVKTLAAMPKSERDAVLASLTPPAEQRASAQTSTAKDDTDARRQSNLR
jgi:predicted aminopeptidase